MKHPKSKKYRVRGQQNSGTRAADPSPKPQGIAIQSSGFLNFNPVLLCLVDVFPEQDPTEAENIAEKLAQKPVLPLYNGLVPFCSLQGGHKLQNDTT